MEGKHFPYIDVKCYAANEFIFWVEIHLVKKNTASKQAKSLDYIGNMRKKINNSSLKKIKKEKKRSCSSHNKAWC